MSISTKKKVISRLVYWFKERHYGFLCSAAEGDEGNTSGYFLHENDIVSGSPEKGRIVRFELVAMKKGPAAANAEIYQTRQDMEQADALAVAAASLVAMVGDSTASTTTDVKESL